MSYCITINNLELLPQEDTLLINYSITCTGLWYLSQLSTAYRNVCDTEWTVMYPNHQHPRHSDFPIGVTTAPYQATFAWNYGGIQGVSAENFDEEHSYLVQLSIFEYGCFNTGQTPSTGEPTGEPTDPNGTTGQPTQTGNPGGGGPGIPSGPVGSPVPPVPNLPNPGSIGSVQMQLPGPQVPGPTADPPNRPLPPLPPAPPAPSGPTTGPRVPSVSAGGVGGPGGGGTSGEPSGVVQSSLYFSQTNVSEPSDPGTLGGQTQTQQPVVNNLSYTNNYTVTFTPQGDPGSNSNPSLSFEPLGISSALPGQTIGPSNTNPGNSKPDLESVSESSEGFIQGSRTANLQSNAKLWQNTPSNQYKASNLESSAFINVQAVAQDITVGEPISVSAVFKPQTSMQARMEIVAQDSRTQIPLVTTGLLECGPAKGLTAGTTTRSNYYTPGLVTVTCLVYDSSDVLIGIRSISVNVMDRIQDPAIISSKATVSTTMPKTILSHGGMSDEPISINLSQGSTKLLYLDAQSAISSFSCALQTTDSSRNIYNLALFTPINGEHFGTGEFSGAEALIPEEVYSTSRYTINNEEVYPFTHVAGISNEPISTASRLALEISPGANNQLENAEGLLYVTSGVSIMQASGLAGTDTITGFLPLGNETYGLVVHGQSSGAVPSTYTQNTETTSPIGVAVWTGLSLSPGDYYSMVPSKNGQINPFCTPTYTSRV